MIIILEGGDQTRGQGEDQGMGQGKSWKRGGEGVDDREAYDHDHRVDDRGSYDHDHGVDDGAHFGRDGEKGDNCDNF